MKTHTRFHAARPYAALACATLLCTSLTLLNGCKANPVAPTVPVSDTGPDPAAANLAGDGTQVLGQSASYAPQQQSESYTNGQQAPAPIVRTGSDADYAYNNTDASYNQGVADGEAAAETTEAPPPLPEYDQPPAPEDDYLWTPGYWAWGDGGYYWVPGAWVPPPYTGALWTPPYWGWYGGHYRFHHGYWGRHVGFYGGVNYGFGYVGIGFFGGYWNSNHFYYNQAVTRVGPSVRTIYNRPVVINNVHYSAQPTVRVSYNGGRGGIDVRPRPAEVAAIREPHTAPIAAQVQVRQAAATNRDQFYNQNHGRPAQAFEARPVAAQPMVPRPEERGGAQTPLPGNRGGGVPMQQPNQVQQRNAEQQQRNMQIEQQHNVQQQQALQQQQHNTQMEQQRNAQLQQQQHNTQVQQQQLQQHNVQAEQQRNMQAEQQRNAQMQQQHNTQMQQQQRNMQPQQQHTVPTPQQMREPAPMQQRAAPAPQARPQEAPRPAPMQAPRPQEAPRPAPAPAQAPHPAAPPPQQHAAPPPAAAPHPAPAPGGHEEHPH